MHLTNFLIVQQTSTTIYVSVIATAFGTDYTNNTLYLTEDLPESSWKKTSLTSLPVYSAPFELIGMTFDMAPTVTCFDVFFAGATAYHTPNTTAGPRQSCVNWVRLFPFPMGSVTCHVLLYWHLSLVL